MINDIMIKIIDKITAPQGLRGPEAADELELALLGVAVHVPRQEHLLPLLAVKVPLELLRQPLALPLHGNGCRFYSTTISFGLLGWGLYFSSRRSCIPNGTLWGYLDLRAHAIGSLWVSILHGFLGALSGA